MPEITAEPDVLPVTRSDLEQGRPQSPVECALAHTLKRNGFRHPNVNSQRITAQTVTAPTGQPVQRYAVSAEVRAFVNHYDGCWTAPDRPLQAQCQPFDLLLVPPRQSGGEGYACTETEYRRMLKFQAAAG